MVLANSDSERDTDGHGSAVSQSWRALETAAEPCLWLQKEAGD